MYYLFLIGENVCLSINKAQNFIFAYLFYFKDMKI